LIALCGYLLAENDRGNLLLDNEEVGKLLRSFERSLRAMA